MTEEETNKSGDLVRSGGGGDLARSPSSLVRRGLEALEKEDVQQVLRTVNRIDGAELVYIPPGPFLMGDDDQEDNPRHKVTLSGYYIYKNLVTVGMYKKFCQETNRQMPPEPDYNGNHFNPNWSKEDHPIVNVSWDDAVAYCVWAGVALPTEAQWEKAVRGVDGRLFPWGNTFDPNKVWASKSQVADAGGTHRVGELGVSPYGCTDMAGNVWQWCADFYDAGFWGSRAAEEPDPVNLSVGEKKYRVLRGGSWDGVDSGLFRASCRGWGNSVGRYDNDGFRAVAAGP